MSDEPSPYAIFLMSMIERGETLQLPEGDIIDLTPYERKALGKAAEKHGYECEVSPSEHMLTFRPATAIGNRRA